MGAVRLLTRLLRDSSGTASIEFTIVLAGMVGAIMYVAIQAAPAVRTYIDHLSAVAQQADQVLTSLQNTPTPGV